MSGLPAIEETLPENPEVSGHTTHELLMTKVELKSKALGMLARRPLTKKELKIRLKRVEPNENAILIVIEELESNGFIDEAAIIEDKIILGKESKLYGRLRIRLELVKRGLSSAEIDESIDQYFPESEEFEIACKFVSRKLSTMGSLSAIKRYRRVACGLQRCGFPGDLISSVLAQYGITPYDDKIVC